MEFACVAISYVIAMMDPVEPERFDWDFLFAYFSVKGYFLLKKEYESIKAVDFCGKLI